MVIVFGFKYYMVSVSFCFKTVKNSYNYNFVCETKNFLKKTAKNDKISMGKRKNGYGKRDGKQELTGMGRQY